MRFVNLTALFSVGFLLSLFFYSESFGQSGVVSGSVSDQFGNLPGAKIVVEGTATNTYTDVNGSYSIALKPGSYTIKVSFVMYATQSKPIVLESGDTLRIHFKLEPSFSIDQEISIGSRAQPRSLLETAMPVDVISPQEISNSPQIELSHILHYLTPSFHSTHQTISDGTDHVDPATIRGLGPDQVLVLVNGKRRHTSALLNVNGTIGKGTVGTDFNAIPVSAIDRVEILRDGAAAQYGSDAIAGVVNIVLKEKTGIVNLDNRIGVNTTGDGLTNYSSANIGFQIGKRGFINLTTEYRQRESTNRAGNYTGTAYAANTTADTTLFFDQNDYSDQRVMEIGNSSTKNIALFFNAEMPISDKISFYSHGGKNFRLATSRAFYRFPKNTEQVVLEIYPHGFSPEISSDIEDNAITIGLHGMKDEWNIDFSNTSGANSFDFNIKNTNNASIGTASPNVFYAGGFEYEQNTTNVDITRNFEWLSDVNVAFGGEFRIDNYKIIAGEESSWVDGGDTLIVGVDTIGRTAGSQGFPGFQPGNKLNKFRTNTASYLDIETNFSEKLLVEIAGRYETYSGFGNQATWKLAGRYKIKDWFSMRAGYATGFRAPSLHQIYFNNTSTQFVNGIAVQVGTYNNESIVTKAFNIEALKPEISRHLSAGLTTRINDKLSFTFDYYSINIKDRIVLSGRFDEGYESLLQPLGVGAAQFFTNAIDTRTTGADGVLAYKSMLGDGSLIASVAANFNQTKVHGSVKAPDALIGEEETLFNREEISRVESVQPNYKFNSLISYQVRKIRIEVRNTLFGEVKYVHPADGGSPNDWPVNEFTGQRESRDQVFSPKLITDAIFSLQINNNIRFTLGGNNIFNVYPDKHTHSANIGDGNFTYSRRTQQFGVKGAYYYASLQLSL